jgi:hypothetical protein
MRTNASDNMAEASCAITRIASRGPNTRQHDVRVVSKYGLPDGDDKLLEGSVRVD